MKTNQVSNPLLDELRRKENLKLKELMDYTNIVIPFFTEDKEPSRYKGTLSDRTVRYYIKEKLIDKPAVYRGCYAYFSYRHVLQLLVIKYLQSKKMSLNEIADYTRKLKNNELEALLFETKNDMLSLGRVNLVEDPKGSDTLPHSPKQALIPNRDVSPNFPNESGEAIWRRFRINETLELHIKDQLEVPRQEINVHGVVRAIAEILTTINRSSHLRNENCSLIMNSSENAYESSHSEIKMLAGHPHDKVIALVTEGGLVPSGNPDRLESAKSKRFLKYNLSGIDDLRPHDFESVNEGWDNRYVNADPDRLVPLDVMRELEKEVGDFRIHEYFYTTTGVSMPVDTARKIGESIAQDLKKQGVSAAIFTST